MPGQQNTTTNNNKQQQKSMLCFDRLKHTKFNKGILYSKTSNIYTSPCSNTNGDTVINIFTLAVTLTYTKNVAIATMMIHFNRAYILLHRALQ